MSSIDPRWASGRRAKIVELVFVSIIFVLLVAQVPLSKGVDLTGDEHFELNQVQLMLNGHALDENGIWRDQPPLYAVVLRSALGTFGNSLLCARLVAVCFGWLLILASYLLLRSCVSRLGAMLSTIWSMSFQGLTPYLIGLSQETAAWAVGLLALLVLVRSGGAEIRTSRLVGSATLLGISTCIKLTSAPVLLCILIYLLPGWRHRWNREDWNRFLRRAGTVIGLVCLVQLVAYWILPTPDWKTHWRSHSTVPTEVVGMYGFRPMRLLDDGLLWISLMAMGFGLRTLLTDRVWISLGVMGVALVLVHWWHRPWWEYYWLQFLMTSSYCVAWTLRWCESWWRVWTRASSAGRVCGWLILSGLALFLLRRAEQEVATLRSSVDAIDTKEIVRVVSLLKEHAPAPTDYVYARDSMLPFLAQKCVVPSLTYISLKRIWCGDATEEMIRREIVRLDAKVLLITSREGTAEWPAFLEKMGYMPEYVAASLALSVYVKRGGRHGPFELP